MLEAVLVGAAVVVVVVEVEEEEEGAQTQAAAVLQEVCTGTTAGPSAFVREHPVLFYCTFDK